ncbi:MAG: serine/threonine protein kinase, partial [Deltaproteobacteria bacterium]|nr:serine/threonine protein kinase [Deltaproteobacteria bacterium]
MSEPDSRVFCPTCFQSFPLGTERCPADGASLVGLPREATLEGTVLDGKYDVFEQLGRGGMGTVYRAVQKLIEREVALKILRTDFTSDLQAVKRFFREAKAVARLRSPNAVILYDFGLASEGHLYYTMELVRGRSLARELKEQGAFPVKRATRIALQVARALEEAHGLGIIHRDLKPSNIMLVGAGDGEVAKVLDFGIAKLLSVPEGSTLLTDSGIALGTPKYMSPEQATGGQVDYRSDLYSLGVILYEMLAGLPPFHGGSPSAVMQRQVSEEPVPLRVMAPDVEIPLPLERLLARLLAKRPGERPRRVTDITPELSALAEGVYDSRTT